MPEAVIYQHHLKVYSVSFARPGALLPVRLHNGDVTLVPWGRRQQEQGEMPVGGWARLDSIYSGAWSVYFPKPVLLPVQRFMKTDYESRVHWYDVVRGQYIQGLLAREEDQYRVYIVTITPAQFDCPYDRWPRMINKVG